MALPQTIMIELEQIAQRNGKTIDPSFLEELSAYAQRIDKDHSDSDVARVIRGLGTIAIALPTRRVGARHVRIGLETLHNDPFKTCRKAAREILDDPDLIPRI